MSNKDKVMIFTGSGQFKVNEPQNKTDKPQYIQATGGKESVVTVHNKCGTPECCGMCESAKKKTN